VLSCGGVATPRCVCRDDFMGSQSETTEYVRTHGLISGRMGLGLVQNPVKTDFLDKVKGKVVLVLN
jgi:hypothetical protein